MPVGGVIDAWRWLTDPYGWLDRAVARRGLTFRARLPTHGEPLVTGDPELIREIVRCPDLDGGHGVAALREAFGGESLISLDGDAHRERRRLVAPWLREPRLERHDGLTAEAVRDAVAELPDAPFSAYELVRKISLRVIVPVVLGALPDAETRATESLTAAFLGSFSSPLVLFSRALHRRVGPWGRAMRHRERLTRHLRELLRRARAGDVDRDSVLGGLLPELSDDEIVAEVLALLLFGHDTGAATLAWAMAHLAQAPRAWERIRDDGEGRFVDACLLESMRLCPVVVHLTRVARMDLDLGGHPLAAGERVLPSAYVAQRNPALYPDPGRFVPERFLDRPPPRHAYFPFGFGTRTCVGEPFVRRQMSRVLVALARRLDLALAPGYRPRPVRHLVLVIPEGGARLVARRRGP